MKRIDSRVSCYRRCFMEHQLADTPAIPTNYPPYTHPISLHHQSMDGQMTRQGKSREAKSAKRARWIQRKARGSAKWTRRVLPVNFANVSCFSRQVLTSLKRGILIVTGRKLRCGGRKPICNNCESRNEECEYKLEPKRRGPGKAPKGSKSKRRKTTGSTTTTLHGDSLSSRTKGEEWLVDGFDSQETLIPELRTRRSPESFGTFSQQGEEELPLYLPPIRDLDNSPQDRRSSLRNTSSRRTRTDPDYSPPPEYK